MSSMSDLLMGDDEGGAQYRPYINTGGPLDILNGKFVPNIDGTSTLSGGLGFTTAVIAEANKFKSTVTNGCMINGMARFPDANGLLYDSEQSTIDPDRLSRMSTLHLDDPEKRGEHLEDVKSRLRIYDHTTDEGENLDSFIDHMKEVRDKKIKNYKSFEVETEILNPMTGKPYRMLIPTFVSIDSWTEALVRQLGIRNEEHTADTDMSKQRIIHMEEGFQKARLMRQLPQLCSKAGIYCLMTGHIKPKISINGEPIKKDLTHMKQGETVNGMSNRFYYLMSAIIKIDNTQQLIDKNDARLSEYPDGDKISAKELQRLMITLIRSKNSASGYQTQLVSSQSHGIQPALSYYDNLRSNKYYGLGNQAKPRSELLGDRNLGRTKIFREARSYESARALELTYQLFFIQAYWSLMDQNAIFDINIETFYEKLLGCGYAISDILNSRGWWTYTDAKPDRPYLSLVDILNIINGTYKPKFLSVSGK